MISAILLSLAAAVASAGCGRGTVELDEVYAPDHQNYLCMNYTRPTPLPCRDAADGWQPRWLHGSSKSVLRGKEVTGPRRFVIYAWWPPVPSDFEAYAEAGFNLALTGNAVAAYCDKRGPNATVTHDELFNVNVETSNELAKLGILTIFNTDNMCNKQLSRSPTVAYGNATGGMIEGAVNLTSAAHPDAKWTGQRAYSKGQTIPELQYITSELIRRKVDHQFAGIQMHDDTLTQNGEVIHSTAWLKENAAWFVPIVNQVSGDSGPQTLYRTSLFISSPEEYPIQCPDGDCQRINATEAARAQMSAYATNAISDARFSLHAWPLFNVGAGGPPLNSSDPDNGTNSVRSDSLVRWMAYSAIAYGAKALNYYCWGGGVWRINTDSHTLPGKPSSIYRTVREVNADAAAWGDILLGGGFSFACSLHTGFTVSKGDGTPSEDAVITFMDEDLLVGVFTSDEAPGITYLLLVDKRVSGQAEAVTARNASILLHPSVGSAEVIPPGYQGPRDTHGLRSRMGEPRLRDGPRRKQPWTMQQMSGEDGALKVTVELIGGGGGFVRLKAGNLGPVALRRASFAAASWAYSPGQTSLLDGATPIKAPSWAYDAWHSRYRPYEGLEVTAGKSFEDGEQTAMIIGASLLGAAPPGTKDAEALAWAGFNIISLEAPNDTDLASYGPAAQAIGSTLDDGYSFGFFTVLEAARTDSVLSEPQVKSLNEAFRCHGRWAGLLLGRDVGYWDDKAQAATVQAAKMLRTEGKGNWLLPLVTTESSLTALKIGAAGAHLAMPLVPPLLAEQSATEWALATAMEYNHMRVMLAHSYFRSSPTSESWTSNAFMPFVAAVDVCRYTSDSMLRWAAFSALAYGARGIFWQGVGTCAKIGSPRFGLLASINKRIVAWGNTFVSDAPTGYNVTRMWASGFQVPGSIRPGSRGSMDLVQAADDDVLVVELGSMGRAASPLIFVVDQRVSETPGAAKLRTLQVTLREDVTATQPIEGDCAASRCQCGLSLLGNTLSLKLPGGSGQLVGLAMAQPPRKATREEQKVRPSLDEDILYS